MPFKKIHLKYLLNLYPYNKVIIPINISSVNIIFLSDASIPGKIGDTIATPNQNTEKLIKKSAETEIKTGSSLLTNLI
jgi:hypothetical protein